MEKIFKIVNNWEKDFFEVQTDKELIKIPASEMKLSVTDTLSLKQKLELISTKNAVFNEIHYHKNRDGGVSIAIGPEPKIWPEDWPENIEETGGLINPITKGLP